MAKQLPCQTRWYYGWIILGAVMVCDCLTAPGHSTGINVFLDDLIAGVGETRSGISFTYSVALVVSAVLTPFAGQAVDRYGVQVVGPIAVVLFGMALFGLSYAQTGLQLGLFFSLLRFAGPECLYVCTNTTLFRWWVKRRGFIAMIRSLDEAFMVGFPAVIGSLLRSVGWRATYRTVGYAAFSVGAVAMWALRSKPEDYGLLPDGIFPDSKIVVDLSDVADSDGDVDTRTAKKSHSRSKSRSKEGREPDWTFAEIIRSPFFWTTVGADMAFKLFWAGTNLHNVDLFGIHGIDTNSVARLSLPFAVGTLCGQMVIGFKIDNLSINGRKTVLTVAFVGLLMCEGWLMVPTGSIFAVKTAVRAAVWYFLYGMCAGVEFTIVGILIADVYGRHALGSINGVVTALGTAASGVGPLLYAICKEKSGDYNNIMQVLFLGLLAAVVLFAKTELAKPPKIRGGRGAPPKFVL